MLQRHSHTVIFLLLFSYLLLGAVGHLETLLNFGFGINPQQILATKGGPAPTAKVYWTQNKHIPSTVKISVPSPAVVARPEVSHRLQIYEVVITPGVSNSYCSPVISLHSPRAPPQT